MKSPDELFDRYLDGELTPEELAELESWIDARFRACSPVH